MVLVFRRISLRVPFLPVALVSGVSVCTLLSANTVTGTVACKPSSCTKIFIFSDAFISTLHSNSACLFCSSYFSTLAVQSPVLVVIVRFSAACLLSSGDMVKKIVADSSPEVTSIIWKV